MNMISQLRRKVQVNGTANISAEEFDQLQAEWITRAGITVDEAKAIKFPTMLRTMWSGTEVQRWLDEHVNAQ